MSDLSQLQRSAGVAPPFAGIRPPNGPPMPGAIPQGVPVAAQTADKKGGGAADGKKKKPIKPIALAVLILLVGYVAKGKIMKPHYGPNSKVPLGQIIDLNSVTTNLSDGHLAQIGVSLQMTVVGSSKEVTKDTSELTGSIVTALGEQTYSSLLPASGRAALKAQLLHSFQADLGKVDGAQQVAGVYFTSFVLQ